MKKLTLSDVKKIGAFKMQHLLADKSGIGGKVFDGCFQTIVEEIEKLNGRQGEWFNAKEINPAESGRHIVAMFHNENKCCAYQMATWTGGRWLTDFDTNLAVSYWLGIPYGEFKKGLPI